MKGTELDTNRAKDLSCRQRRCKQRRDQSMDRYENIFTSAWISKLLYAFSNIFCRRTLHHRIDMYRGKVGRREAK